MVCLHLHWPRQRRRPRLIPRLMKFGFMIMLGSGYSQDQCKFLLVMRGSTWRERVTRMRITLIFNNFPQSLTFCEIFTSKFHSVYVDCRRLWEIVKDSACTFCKLLKIACLIVKDCLHLVLILATHSLRLILHLVLYTFYQYCSQYRYQCRAL